MDLIKDVINRVTDPTISFSFLLAVFFIIFPQMKYMEIWVKRKKNLMKSLLIYLALHIQLAKQAQNTL